MMHFIVFMMGPAEIKEEEEKVCVKSKKKFLVARKPWILLFTLFCDVIIQNIGKNTTTL